MAKQTKTNHEVQQDNMGIWGDNATFREQMVGRYNGHKDAAETFHDTECYQYNEGWLAGFEYALHKLGFELDQSEDRSMRDVTLTQEKLAAIAEQFEVPQGQGRSLGGRDMSKKQVYKLVNRMNYYMSVFNRNSASSFNAGFAHRAEGIAISLRELGVRLDYDADSQRYSIAE